jgi:hypothetical protein
MPESRPQLTYVWTLALLLVAGCAGPPAAPDPIAPLDWRYAGTGRLALVWEAPAPDGDLRRLLTVHDRHGATPQPLSGVAEARWLENGALLLSLDADSDDPAQWGLTELAALDVEAGVLLRLVPPRRHFDPEISPDGEWLAVGVELNERGESDLELWYLAGEPRRVASLRQPLDEPRWSPDGADLVVSRAIQDPNAEASESSASFAGVGLVWPRLFRMRRDLARLRLLPDGAPGADLSPGGSYPLWWDARGIWARQRRGLVRCDPGGSGCTLVYDPGEERRVFDGRRAGEGSALLLVLDTRTPERLASEIHRVDLATGAGATLLRAPPATYLLDLDWTPGGG